MPARKVREAEGQNDQNESEQDCDHEAIDSTELVTCQDGETNSSRRTWRERRAPTRDPLRDSQCSNQRSYPLENRLKMPSRSFRKLAASCTALHVLRPDKGAFST
jgi:hypothetical protein